MMIYGRPSRHVRVPFEQAMALSKLGPPDFGSAGGLAQCKKCGSHYAAVGRDYLACSAARGSGTCSNRQSIRRGALESLILDGLRQKLMAPELVEAFIRAFQKEVNLQRREDD